MRQAAASAFARRDLQVSPNILDEPLLGYGKGGASRATPRSVRQPYVPPVLPMKDFVDAEQPLIGYNSFASRATARGSIRQPYVPPYVPPMP